MKIVNIKLNELNADEKFLISNPVKTKRHFEFIRKFPGSPSIQINKRRVIVGGEDSFFYLKGKGGFTRVLETDLNDKDSLFLAYNLRKSIEELNVWEKLNFLKNILTLADRKEIYERTGIEIKINDDLIKYLPVILEKRFEELLIKGKITIQTAKSICKFNLHDQEDFLFLFKNVTFSSSFQHNILEIVEETEFRDKCSVDDIFARTGIKDLMAEEKPQRDILSALSELRYPEYSVMEKEWVGTIKSLRLSPGFSVSHFPFFEKKGVELKIIYDTPEDLKKGLKKLIKD